MYIFFTKYQGAGNDFIVMDNRDKNYDSLSSNHISFLCNRQMGVGADGLILIEKSNEAAFEMKYFNADGNIGSLCGNGSRCAVAFAHKLGIIKGNTTFIAYDGIHKAKLIEDHYVELEMNNIGIENISMDGQHYVLDTGSPHMICTTKDVENMDVFAVGRKIRYSEKYKTEGINVNFIHETHKNELIIRTYERGVENETLACGTGITAAAIAYIFEKQEIGSSKVYFTAKGGSLLVKFHFDGKVFKNIWLCGRADYVFEGEINI